MLYDRPLDHSKREIRLLEIIMADCIQTPLECKLSTVSLDDGEDFTALSYVWGDATDTVNITVNGLCTPITKNLASALQHLREISKQKRDKDSPMKKLSTRLWVDALCINQQNVDERNHQIQWMRDIYSEASLVVSWLGQDDNDHMALAIKTIETIAREVSLSENSLENLEWVQQYPWLHKEDQSLPDLHNAAWNAVKLFCNNAYWRRVWILQECAVAHSLCIMSGLTVLDFAYWRHFKHFHESLASKDASHIFGSHLSFFLAQPYGLGLARVLLIDVFRSNPLSQTGFQKDVFLSTRTHLATDPRDKIFALQVIIGLVLIPDYKLSIGEIYALFAKEWVLHSELDILVWSGLSTWQNSTTSPYALPSWIPDWQARSLTHSWIPPGTFSIKYSSSNGLEELCRLQPLITNDFYLKVDGCICDAIERVQQVEIFSTSGVFWKFCANYLRLRSSRIYPTGITSFEASLRLFLAEFNPWDKTKPLDRSSLQHAITSYNACLIMAERRKLHHDEDSEHTLSEDDVQLLQTLLSEFLVDTDYCVPESAASATNDRIAVLGHVSNYSDDCGVFCTLDGYLGMSSSKVQNGDKVCFLNSCPFPVVLREYDSHCVHVGPCIVVGLMNGEAAQLVKEKKICIQEFEIR